MCNGKSKMEDLSFSFDENDNVLTISSPWAQSTPLKNKRNKTQGPNDVSSATNFSLSATDLSLSRLRGDDSCRIQAPAVFRKPQTTKVKKKPKFVCTYCGKGYIDERSYKNHVMNHKVQSAATIYPKREEVIKNVKDIAINSFYQVYSSVSCGDTGERFRKLLDSLRHKLGDEDWLQFSSILADNLLKGAVGTKFLLPSKLLGALIAQVENVLSDRVLCKSLCDELLEMIPLCEKHETDVCFIFIVKFTLTLSKEILRFISTSIRAAHPCVTSSPADLDDEDLEVIFYIGGSVLRGYLRAAGRNKTNPMWTTIASTIRTKLLREKPEDEKCARWTIAVDRGGLLYLSGQCQEFFVSLTKVVFKCEQRDGSIDYEQVLTIVSTSNISILWDTLIFDCLPENLSVNLMNDVVKCFCQTCGRGFAKRRLNSLRKRPMVSMPTRHLVATRKK